MSSQPREIGQQKIKDRLNEVIAEIEREVENEVENDHSETKAAKSPSSSGSLSSPSAPPEGVSDKGAPSQTMSDSSGHEDDQSQQEPSQQPPAPRVHIIPVQTLASNVHIIPVAVEGSDSVGAARHLRTGPAEPTVPSGPPPPATDAGVPALAFGASTLPRSWAPGRSPPGAAGQPAGKEHRIPITLEFAPESRPATSPPPPPPLATNMAHTLPRRGSRTGPPKKVHFADEPQVQLYDDQAPREATPPSVRHLSASAAAQLGPVGNRTARPFGRTSPPAADGDSRTSPPFVGGEGRTSSPPPAVGGGDTESAAAILTTPTKTSVAEEASDHDSPEKSQSASTVPLEKVFTPAQATDDTPTPPKKKMMFVDSTFFSPHVHPTWEQQVAMAKKISASLSDASNRCSRGQSMYEKRKKRSPKWVHQGGGPIEPEDSSQPSTTLKNKPLLKLVMNPQGQVYDLQALKEQGLLTDAEGGLSPVICSKLVKDLQSSSGRGSQIFAKRKKRSEKWVVDEDHPEQSRPEDRPTTQLLSPRPPSPVPVKPVLLEELCQSPQPPRFPTDGVYSPRVPQPWGVHSTAGPRFPEPVAPPQISATISDTAEPVPRPPPPTCTLSDSVEESLRAMEEKRRQRAMANYNTAPRGWTDHDIYYRPVTFGETAA